MTIGNYDTTNGLGLGASAVNSDEFGGTLDEVRVSSVGRSAGWVTTEYNNQNSPNTFATLSDVSGGTPVTTNYTYDYRNRMVGTTGGTTSSYGYDVSGERVKAVLGGVTTISPTRGYSLEGSTPVKQIYAGSTLVATVKGTGASATTYTVATDHLTGSNAVSTSAGALEELMDYYPYGSPRLDEKAGSFNEKRKFAGHEYDSETGLSYMVARYYDGGLGRFYGQDQMFWRMPSEYLIDPQQQNSYSYARNNPMRYIDPTGMFNIQTGEIEKGDTLTGITKQLNSTFGTSLTTSQVATANGIKDKNKISVGNFIILPKTNLELRFDNKNLYAFDKTYQITFKDLMWAAVSGNKGNDPIDEGTWLVDPKRTEYYDNLSVSQKAKSQVGRGLWPGGKRSWGEARTELTRKDATVGPLNTQTGYYIHGGAVPGSRGCIDLTNQTASFHSWLTQQWGKPIDLQVDY